MRLSPSGRVLPAALCALLLPTSPAQEPRPSEAKDANTIAVQAKLVIVPAVIHDKKGLVTNLTQSDFAITIDGKPQTVRYFDRDTDVPLTVGLLVDVSRSQTSVIDDEQKASQKFLDTFLMPASGNRPADKAFILQFAHSAELLQDVTDSHPLLAAGLKEIGTQAPGSPDDEDKSTTASNNGGNGNNNPNSNGGNQPNNNGGYGNGGGYGGYGRRGGNPNSGNNGGGGSTPSNRPSSGTVLYDSLFLSSNDVLSKQTGRRALIVLTDGVDRHSKEGLKGAIEAAQRADTVVFAIYYKGQDHNNFGPMRRGYDGGYDPYGRYPPTTGGSTDPGTYRDPDGKKILQKICSETGGEMFELKGKGAIDAIYKEIGDQLRAQYRLGFTPGFEAAGAGYHPIQLTLTNPANKKLEVQTREGYYAGPPVAQP